MSLFGTYVAFCTERLLQHLMPRSTNETSTRLDVPNKEDKTAPAFAIHSLRLAQSFPAPTDISLFSRDIWSYLVHR